MKRKTFDLLEVKTDEDGQQPGSFSALASVFGNVDHVGDRVMPGAFKKTLKKWRESGRPLPVILSHLWENPFALVGKADPRAVIETEDGLLVQGTLDIEGNDTAKQVHKLMKEGLMTGWSFGYTVPDGGEKLDDGVNEISEIDLVEVGPTLKGANSEAQLQAVKSALDEEAPPDYDTKTVAELLATPANGTTGNANFKVYVGENAITDFATVDVSDTTVDAPESEEKTDVIPLSDEALRKALEEDERVQAYVTEQLEERLKVEPDPEVPKPRDLPEPVKDLLAQEVKSADEKPESPPVKAAANDPLKDEIARLRLEIAADL